MNAKVGTEVLLGVKKILDEKNIEFWLDYGTLLGAVRAGAFIPSDNDIDIAVRREDIPKVIRKKKFFRKAGYEMFYSDTDIELKKNGCYIGISSYDIRGKKAYKRVPKDYEYNPFGRAMWYAWHALMVPNYCDLKERKQSKGGKAFAILVAILVKSVPYFVREQWVWFVDRMKEKYGAEWTEFSVPSKYFASFTTVSFCGEQFVVPELYEEYLVARYGNDWRVPISNEKWTRKDRAEQQLR